jgi:hypothetical protein
MLAALQTLNRLPRQRRLDIRRALQKRPHLNELILAQHTVKDELQPLGAHLPRHDHAAADERHVFRERVGHERRLEDERVAGGQHGVAFFHGVHAAGERGVEGFDGGDAVG